MKIDLFESAGSDRPLYALSLLLTGVFALAFQDSLVKLMSSQTSFWQFQSLRSFGNLSLLVLLAAASSGLRILTPKNWRPVYLRAVLLTLCMFCFFSSAPFLSITQMAAGLYTYPMFVSLLAGPVLGETVGRWRIGALLLGMAGAALILQPWDDSFSLAQTLPVIAGFFFALNVLVIRKGCRNESTLAMAFAVGVMFLLSGICGVILLSIFPLPEVTQIRLPFVAIGWPELTMIVVGFAALTSLLNLTGNICLSRAYQTADSSWLAPIDFSYLFFAAIWGRVLFDHWPTWQALLGMALIAAAGMVTAWRENRTEKPRQVNWSQK